MALKDLVAQKAAITEAAVEEIIAEYVRYDVDEAEIVFTPTASELSNKEKILVYLVALQGWPFVTETDVPTEAKPVALGEALGIPGGSLRPILKNMKDRRFITVRAGAYSVKSSALEAIKGELGSKRASDSSTPAKRKNRKKPARTKFRRKSKPDKAAKNKKAPARTGISDTFSDWIDEGFFDDARTLSEVQEKFHEEGIIIARTSMPKYLLGAVRKKRLTRQKEEIVGKQIWVYKTKK